MSGNTFGENGTALQSLQRPIVMLLAMAVFLNYVDRGNLATVSPLIKSEFGLTNTQMGLLLSSFFFSYVPGQLLIGWLLEKLSALKLLAIGLSVWSLATASMSLVNGFGLFLCLRVILGLGESASFPCSAALLARNLPADELGAANGLIVVGISLGPACGTLIGALLAEKLGWRPTFAIFGAMTLIWLVPCWMLNKKSALSLKPARSENAPSFSLVLRQPSLWAASLGNFSANYAFYFVASWLPLYLVKERGFPLSEMASVGAIVYVFYAISAAVAGPFSDALAKKNANGVRIRRIFCIVAHVSLASCLTIAVFGNGEVAVIGLLLAGISFGINTPNMLAIGQTLAGPTASGKWIGFQNSFANLAGIVGPTLTGLIVDKTGHFSSAFMIAALMSLLGAGAWARVSTRPVSWTKSDSHQTNLD